MDWELISQAFEIVDRYEVAFLTRDDWEPYGPCFRTSDEYKKMHAALAELARENDLTYEEFARLLNRACKP